MRQCWPEPPAQPFRSTNRLLRLCLFNSNGIQAREIHYCFCQGGLRLAERMHRRALTGGSTLRRAVYAEPSARSTLEGVCFAPPPGVWGQEQTPVLLPAGMQPSKTLPKCQVSTEALRGGQGLSGTHTCDWVSIPKPRGPHSRGSRKAGDEEGKRHEGS